MNVLVVGGGGREHALAWRLAQSPKVTRVLAAPGNAGIASVAECVPVAADDVDAIVNLVDERDVGLTVVGPEGPLVAGLVDALVSRSRAVFGPTAAAAQLEGSKAFAKEVMSRAGVPTARYMTFDDPGKAIPFVDELGGRAVIKADGLAAGKGVVVAHDRDVAIAAIEASLVRGAFGAAGSTIVVEELLEGPEISAFALSDGERVVPLTVAQDFKRVGDHDQGPNTGGMGAYSPLPWLHPTTRSFIWDGVMRPMVAAMAEHWTPYRGVLYAGLMLTSGGPKVLEFNCRFGDPETEVLLPRLETDLLDLLVGAATTGLGGVRVDWRPEASVTVVCASGGYPDQHATGIPIKGLDKARKVDGVSVFHAGTEDRDGTVVTAGGRVLAVTALGDDLAAARERAYEACGRISFDGMHYRKDIAAAAAGG